MIVTVTPGAPWRYEATETRTVLFASVSVPAGSATIEVFWNGELQDRIHTSVPHSWWKLAGQPFVPQLHSGDVVEVTSTSTADLRVDFE